MAWITFPWAERAPSELGFTKDSDLRRLHALMSRGHRSARQLCTELNALRLPTDSVVSVESVEREMKMLNYKADAKLQSAMDKEFANQEGPQGVLPEYPAPVPMQQPCPRPTAAAAQATVPVTLAGVQVQPLQPAAQTPQAPQAPQAALQAHMHNTLPMAPALQQGRALLPQNAYSYPPRTHHYVRRHKARLCSVCRRPLKNAADHKKGYCPFGGEDGKTKVRTKYSKQKDD
eukprot:m.242700 g.242700  ORF g.242700 m.242700 type:complete len:232 (-) comp17455_c1_seq63:189-884(-)